MAKPNQGPRLKLNRATGIYFIHWTDKGRSKRRSTGASDIGIAQQVLAAFLTLSEQQERVAAASGPLLVMDVLGDPDAPDGEDYWHEHVVPNVADKERASRAIKRLTGHFGAMAVKDIMPADVDAYVRARRSGRIGRPSVDHTISTELSYLNAAITLAMKARRLTKAEVPFIQLPGTSPARERWLEAEELSRLLDAARWPSGPRAGPRDKLPRVYRFIALAYGTAGRKASVQELQRYQVDTERGVIDLNKRGRKQTRKRRAKVKISDWLRPIVDRILEQIPDDPQAYLLDHPGCIYTAFDNAVERAGLAGTGVTPHVLRHTRATHMALGGADLWAIADVLGDTVATVEKTYAHLHPDYQTKAVNAGPTIAQPLRVVGGKG
jgi:integrase